MKTLRCLLMLLGGLATAQAQYNQYQYPNDPYGSSSHPQSSYGSGAPITAHTYDKLLTYGSLEARYNYNDYKGSDIENSSGFSVGLHAPLFKPLYLSFGLNFLDGSNSLNQTFDLTTLLGGVGAYIPIGQRFHLFGEVGLRADISTGKLDYINPDSFAVYLEPGVRFAVTERWELEAGVFFSTTENLDDNVIQLNSYFALLSVLDLSVGVDFADNLNTYHAGLRLRW